LSLELRRKGLLASPLTRPDASKAWFWHFLAVAGRVDPRQLSGLKTDVERPLPRREF
jgi:hypothetical protein